MPSTDPDAGKKSAKVPAELKKLQKKLRGELSSREVKKILKSPYLEALIDSAPKSANSWFAMKRGRVARNLFKLLAAASKNNSEISEDKISGAISKVMGNGLTDNELVGVGYGIIEYEDFHDSMRDYMKAKETIKKDDVFIKGMEKYFSGLVKIKRFPNTRYDDVSYRILNRAAIFGHAEVIKRCDISCINEEDGSDRTPLGNAIDGGHVGAVTALLSRGSDPTEVSSRRVTALDRASQQEENSEAIVESLLNAALMNGLTSDDSRRIASHLKDQSPEWKEDALRVAITDESARATEALLQAGAEVDFKDYDLRNKALASGSPVLVSAVLIQEDVEFNQEDLTALSNFEGDLPKEIEELRVEAGSRSSEASEGVDVDGNDSLSPKFLELMAAGGKSLEGLDPEYSGPDPEDSGPDLEELAQEVAEVMDRLLEGEAAPPSVASATSLPEQGKGGKGAVLL